MKLLYFLLVASFFTYGSLETKNVERKCIVKPAETVPSSWSDMVKSCIEKLEVQVKDEMNASLTYLSMGAYFAQDKVNRLGFSKFFFDSANEERQHAIKIIDYLLMRGQFTDKISDHLINFSTAMKFPVIQNGSHALQEALKLETQITKKIYSLIKVCEKPGKENFNDYHLVDYFTGEFLEEQYKSQRDLAGKLTTLGTMEQKYGKFGEFLFDKKLLYGEI